MLIADRIAEYEIELKNAKLGINGSNMTLQKN